MLETGKERIAKDLAECSQSPARPGTPDCPVVHRTVSGAPGWTPMNRPLSRKVGGATGLSGEPTITSATVGRAIRGRRMVRANGRQGAPDCPMCTGQCPCTNRPRDATVICARKGRRSAPDHLQCCPVAHRTIRWRTGLFGAPLDRRQG